jgi:hypothetical protein
LAFGRREIEEIDMTYLNGARFHRDLIEGKDKGSLGDFIWIKPYPFAHKILMNVFAEEGFVYPASHGTKYFEYPEL